MHKQALSALSRQLWRVGNLATAVIYLFIFLICKHVN